MITKTYKIGTATVREHENTEFEIPEGFEFRPITTRENVNGKLVVSTINLLMPIKKKD